MAIDYAKRPTTRTRPATAPSAAPAASQARTELRYWVDQYRRLTAQLEAAQVTNNDQWRKERVNTRELYSRRAAAASRMAHFADQVLTEHP